MAGVDGEHTGPFLRASLRVDRRLRLEAEQARAYGVPHSVFTGRVVGPGEPEFLREDTDIAIALAEEEADTCSQCGQPKVWCRDAANHQFSFEAVASVCWATEALEAYKKTDGYQKLKDTVQAATQVSSRWRDGKEPDVLAGLDVG